MTFSQDIFIALAFGLSVDSEETKKKSALSRYVLLSRIASKISEREREIHVNLTSINNYTQNTQV